MTALALKGPLWTEEEKARLRELVAAGVSTEDIAAELGRSVNAIVLKRRRIIPRDIPAAPSWKGSPLGNRRWWTQERVTAGLQDFASKHRGQLPNSDQDYSTLKKGHMEWPPASRVLEFFGTMADAWEAGGAPRSRVTRQWVEWTQEDDDYLLERAGSVTLKIIAKQLGRSWAACKRRLYDLGAGPARDLSGYLSAQQVAKEYGCPVDRVQKLIATGKLPARKVLGGHYWCIDPDDAEKCRAELTKPRRSHHRYPIVGDYDRRNGYVRRRVDGRVVRVPVTDAAVKRDAAKLERRKLEEAKRRAVQMLEERGLIIDLGAAS